MRRFMLAIIMMVALMAMVFVSVSVMAQGGANDPTPVPYTPGVAVFGIATATVNPTICLTPLPIKLNTQIYIKSGVNIRNQPSESGALVWNTVYNNYDEEGALVDNPVSVLVTVTEGPTCAGGLNWWKVVGLEEPGWVAEGRPERGGYYVIVPGLDAGGCYSLYPLSANTTADLYLNAKVRVEPSLQGLVKTVAPSGTPVTIVSGSRCVDGLVWWQVRVTVVNFTYEGWMSESEDGNYYLVPRDLPNTADGTLCGTPLNLPIGQQAYVNTRGGSAKALRSTPGEDGALLFSLVDNVPIVIEGGTVCRDNLNWWKVRVLASQEVIGWMAEGSAGVGYWISTIDPNEFAK